MVPPFSPTSPTVVKAPQTPLIQVIPAIPTITPTTAARSITDTAGKKENTAGASIGFGSHVLASRGVSKRRYLAACNSINMKAVTAM
ncbi:hypothetical protein AA313_de0202807 [Arthrobotrys entomopaga]|nr:hypothetical protein AA313_de0202807 [Arthrobotrys entomopaga]